MRIYILVNEDGTIEGWGSTKGMDSQIEVEIAEDHEILNTNPKLFVYIDGQIVKSDSLALENAKRRKLEELNRACSDTIKGRFSHTIDGVFYWFANDLEAQSNFDKCDRAFEKGYMTEMMWTCYDSDGNVTRVNITAETFPPLYMAHLNHIQGNISRFRDTLMPLVESATTIGEIETITW